MEETRSLEAWFIKTNVVISPTAISEQLVLKMEKQWATQGNGLHTGRGRLNKVMRILPKVGKEA